MLKSLLIGHRTLDGTIYIGEKNKGKWDGRITRYLPTDHDNIKNYFFFNGKRVEDADFMEYNSKVAWFPKTFESAQLIES